MKKLIVDAEHIASDKIVIPIETMKLLLKELEGSVNVTESLQTSSSITLYLTDSKKCLSFEVACSPDENKQKWIMKMIEEQIELPFLGKALSLPTIFGMRRHKVPKLMIVIALVFMLGHVGEWMTGVINFATFMQISMYFMGMIIFMNLFVMMSLGKDIPHYICAAKVCDKVREKTVEELITSADPFERWIGCRLAKNS